MTIADMYIGEMEQEAATTRKFLEAIPEDKLAWKPHEKSLTAGQLALHIAGLQGGVSAMAAEDELRELNIEFPQPSSKAEIMDAFETSNATARRTVAGFDDGAMAASWKLFVDGTQVLELPRAAMLRAIMMNHLYHHRGQLGVYLRLMGATVPSAYGPSGDEAPDFMAS